MTAAESKAAAVPQGSAFSGREGGAIAGGVWEGLVGERRRQPLDSEPPRAVRSPRDRQRSRGLGAAGSGDPSTLRRLADTFRRHAEELRRLPRPFGVMPRSFGASRDLSASCRRPSPGASTLRRFGEALRRLPKPFGNPPRRVAGRRCRFGGRLRPSAPRRRLSAGRQRCDRDGNNRGEAATPVVEPPNVVAKAAPPLRAIERAEFLASQSLSEEVPKGTQAYSLGLQPEGGPDSPRKHQALKGRRHGSLAPSRCSRLSLLRGVGRGLLFFDSAVLSDKRSYCGRVPWRR